MDINKLNLYINYYGIGKCYTNWTGLKKVGADSSIWIVFDGYAEYDDGINIYSFVKNHIYFLPSGRFGTIRKYPDKPLDHMWVHFNMEPVSLMDDIYDLDIGEFPYLEKLVESAILKAKSCLGFYSREEWSELQLPEDFRYAYTKDRPLACEKDKEFEKKYTNSIEIFHLLCTSLVDAILLESKGNTNQIKNEYVEKTVRYIHDNYDKDISIRDISREVGICKEYLIALFKKRYCVTPYHYLTIYRINVADNLIGQRHSIKSAAEAVHIDPKKFGKIYKKLKGNYPSEAHHYKSPQ
ncbi:MAG TPA: hypothetical protein DCY35_12185 [Prolixibacteraceae bacterium]|nr:hypothetical protein [Prolixibacteraceae bacterium]